MPVSKDDVWTVVGAGMGGKGLLAELGINGFRLRAHDKREDQIAGIRSAGGLHVEGRSETFAPIEVATLDPSAALDGARVILISVSSNDTPQVARDLAPFLKDGQIIVLVQGHFLGAVAFENALKDVRCRALVGVADMGGYPYMMAVRAPDRVFLDSVKAYYQLGAIPSSRAKTVFDQIGFAFQNLTPAENLLQCGFANGGGALFHIAGMLTNVGRVEAGSPYNFFEPYNFYAANMTPGTCNLIEAMDRERVAVARAYSIDVPNIMQWLEQTFDRRDKTLAGRLQANAMTHYRDSPAPNSLKHRYLSGDVPCNLVPVAELGRVAKVPTPVIDSVICVADALTQRNFRKEGRNLKSLGLDGKSVVEILNYVS